MSNTVVYLVTGANRGIGLGLVTALAAQSNAVVFAGARDPARADALQALAAAHPGKVQPVTIVSADEAGNKAAVAEITAKAGRLDVVIANAGICTWTGPSATAPAQEMQKHFEVNVLGPLVLFQACVELLAASGGTAKFAMISSRVGSIEQGATWPHQILPYGASKAAGHYVARKLHFEHAKDGIVVFCMCPGGVDTDMDRTVRKSDPVVAAQPPGKTVAQTAPMLLAQIEKATSGNTGGQWIQFDGAPVLGDVV